MRHRDLIEKARRAVMDSEASLSSDVRRAAESGTGVPPEASALVSKIHQHASQVTDEDVRALRERGWSEDQVFELTVASAFGAGLFRLQRALAVLKK